MNNKMLTKLVEVWLLLCVVVGCGGGTTGTGGRINGALLDAEGFPLVGAEVTLVGTAELVSTDANGNFDFSAVDAEGPIEIEIQSGDQTGRVTLDESPGAENDLDVTLMLLPPDQDVSSTEEPNSEVTIVDQTIRPRDSACDEIYVCE